MKHSFNFDEVQLSFVIVVVVVVAFCFWCHLKNYCLVQSHDGLFLFSSKSFIVLVFNLSLWPILNENLYMIWGRGSTLFLCIRYPAVLAPFLQRLFFPTELSSNFVKNHLTVIVSFYFWTLSWIPLIYFLMPVMPHSLFWLL